MTTTAQWSDLYAADRGGSRQLHRRAQRVFANGVTHQIRVQDPFPIYVTRAEGAHKWDVDGHRYVDYVCGHGALLLGHSHPAVVAAVCEQMAKGTHYGACHELEVRWGELVQQLVPSAERVRFVSSGTEAVMMAFRLARAFTGRPKVLKFQAHFHGWHDYGMAGLSIPFETPASPGIPEAIFDTVVVCPAGDSTAVEAALGRGDVAAAIVEPGGAHFGQVPLRPGSLADLRRLCTQHGTLLILDEVVTGFRYAPGGVQALSGVIPDLTTLAKILAGGLPGGAVVGRADVMAAFEFRDDPRWNRYRRLDHPGTFNANPLSAAAGVAALEIIATGQPNAAADRLAAQLRADLNAALERRGIAGCVHGDSSIFHIYFGPAVQRGPEGPTLASDDPLVLLRVPAKITGAFRGAMLTQGVDLIRSSGLVSAAHGDADVAQTVAAFEAALDLLLSDHILSSLT